MTASVSADAMVALAALAGFLVLFYGPWQAACTDLARQFLFERRAQLFGLAATENLDFDSKVYQEARIFLNGMIRFSHDLTWPRLAWARFCRRSAVAPTRSDQLFTLIDDIEDEQTKIAVRRILFEGTTSLMVMMAIKSVFLVVPIGTIYLLGYCTKVWSAFTEQSVAMAERSSDHEASKAPLMRSIARTIQATARNEYGDVAKAA